MHSAHKPYFEETREDNPQEIIRAGKHFNGYIWFNLFFCFIPSIGLKRRLFTDLSPSVASGSRRI